jgi:hypothetical protein
MGTGRKMLAVAALVASLTLTAGCAGGLPVVLPGTDTGTTPGISGAVIGEAQAKNIALADAGVAAADASFVRCYLDRDYNRYEYDVEFYVGYVEYDYEIDAYTGFITSRDRDID